MAIKKNALTQETFELSLAEPKSAQSDFKINNENYTTVREKITGFSF